MASDLLKCSICPSQPDFSDLSHLLTHISSKGHLAHLHKLQVRSHQEGAAGQQLLRYDAWYQQNGLARLLSERMQQKEARKSSTSANKRSKTASRKTRKLPTAAQTHALDLVPEYPTRLGLRSRPKQELQTRLFTSLPVPIWNDNNGLPGTLDSEDESEFYSSPTRRLRPRRNVQVQSRGIMQPSSDEPFLDDEESEASKLKGLIWPGMDLFDAATDDMKRKRNQKKDGSLLKQMEKASELIEATEIIYSPSGTMRKQRPITGNVDEDSPLKGETPIPKKRPARPKRASLAVVDPNISSSRRAVRRPLNKVVPGTRIQVPRPYLPNSSTTESFDRGTHYSPTGDEKNEFGLTFGYLAAGTENKELRVFKDGHDGRDTQDTQSDSQQQSKTTSYPEYPDYSQYFSDHSSLSMNQLLSQPNPFGFQFPSLGQNQSLRGPGKENFDPSFGPQPQNTSFQHNPLGWSAQYSEHQDTDEKCTDFQSNWMTTLQPEPLAYSSNPLSLAFQQLDNHQEPFTNPYGGLEGGHETKETIPGPYPMSFHEE